MKVYIPGLPSYDTETGEVTMPSSAPPKLVLQFTRTKLESGSPLVNGDTPQTPSNPHVPHSINQKPEVEI